jgi:hypothetical protein
VGERRIRVSTKTRALLANQSCEVLVVGLSARTALFVTRDDPGVAGETVTLYLPTVHGELELFAGVEQVDKTNEGFAVAVAFIVAEQQTRQALNDLMTLLLAGDGGGSRTHPRVIYDVAIRYGEALSQYGRLDELSVRGAGVRVREEMAMGAQLMVSIPDFASDDRLVMTGRVVNQRPSNEGGYHTGVEFVSVAPELRAQLARLLADLLCR